MKLIITVAVPLLTFIPFAAFAQDVQPGLSRTSGIREVLLNSNGATDRRTWKDDTRPLIETDGKGNWVTVWYSDSATGHDINWSRSRDYGDTWTSEEKFNTDWLNYEHDLASDKKGNFVVVWTTHGQHGEIMLDTGHLFAVRSSDGGASWTTQQPMNVGGNGKYSSGKEKQPDLASDGAGTWVAAWASLIEDGRSCFEIVVSRSTDAGATWSAPQPFALDEEGQRRQLDYHSYPSVAGDGQGNWVVSWITINSSIGDHLKDRMTAVAHSTDNGLSWSRGKVLGDLYNGRNRVAAQPRVVADGKRNWRVVWSTRGQYKTVYMTAESLDNGMNWADPEVLSASESISRSIGSSLDLSINVQEDWLAFWSSNTGFQAKGYTDREIFFSRSVDGGATWGSPEIMNTNAPYDIGRDMLIDVASDESGHWVAVWQSTDSMGHTIDSDADILVARSADHGNTWTYPKALNADARTDTSSSLDFGLSMAMDNDANVVALWHSADDLDDTLGRDEDILVARSSDYGATWSTAKAIHAVSATDGANDEYPQIVTDGKGTWVAVWTATDDLKVGEDYGDIFVSRSTDTGSSWMMPRALDAGTNIEANVHFDSHLETDGLGTWLVFWRSREYTGEYARSKAELYASWSSDNGITWTAPVLVDSGSSFAPRRWHTRTVVADGAARWVSVWISNRYSRENLLRGHDLFVAWSTDKGRTWSSPIILATSGPNGMSQPRMATDRKGTWVVVWTSSEDFYEDIGVDADILVSRSTDDAQTWSRPTALNPDAAIDTDATKDSSCDIATDGRGNWLAVWTSTNDLKGTIGPDSDIFMISSTDNGATWESQHVLNSYAAADFPDDYEPRIVTNGNGNWVVSWRSNYSGVDPDFLASHFFFDGKGRVGYPASVASGPSPTPPRMKKSK